MTSPIDACRRRLLLAASALVAAGVVPVARAAKAEPPHLPFGRVEPVQPAPPLPLVGDDARPSNLVQQLHGHCTAVQLMFTGCSATCPIQGALFAEVAHRLPAGDGRLLSLSIDPLNDDPKALAAWLRRYAPPTDRWHAAAPKPRDVDKLLDFLRGRGSDADRHATQIYLFDRRARFVYRTADFPKVANVLGLLGEIAAAG